MLLSAITVGMTVGVAAAGFPPAEQAVKSRLSPIHAIRNLCFIIVNLRDVPAIIIRLIRKTFKLIRWFVGAFSK
jgi:hypothetical protein